MITKGIIVIPTQGFANRMRMMASSYVLANKLNLKLYICWIPSTDCNIQLSDFLTNENNFKQINLDDVNKSKYSYYDIID